ncbi:MAG: flagellar basal body P-ring formation chaperone FlgA, partial [Parvularculaceae bacterium]
RHNGAYSGDVRDPVRGRREIRVFAGMSGWRGFLGYLTFLLWLLLTMLAPVRADAGESGPVLVRAADILPAIEEALMAKGLAADAEISLANPDAVITVPADAAPVFENVSFNRASGRFLIRARGLAGAPSVAIVGLAKTLARLPVLVAPLARGETVADDNIDWVETTVARPADFIMETEDLVGMEARRALQPGEPLRPIDVVAPVLVKRGSLVTMTYSASGLTLTHAGVAQEAGAKGDLIDVKNVKSEHLVKAVIAGENLVSVASARLAAAAISSE